MAEPHVVCALTKKRSELSRLYGIGRFQELFLVHSQSGDMDLDASGVERRGSTPNVRISAVMTCLFAV